MSDRPLDAESSLAFDVLVIGAGPAGLAAAVTAGEAGLRVGLVDQNPRTGGSYARQRAGGRDHRESTSALRGVIDCERRLAGLATVTTIFETTVWALEGSAGHFVARTRSGERNPVVGAVSARVVIIATGAHDRHLPFPGWDLPGVVSGGAAQSMVKGSGVAGGSRVVVAGTGPFLLAVAATMIEAGATVAAVVEATDPRVFAARSLTLAGGRAKLGEGARYAALLARHRVPYLRRHRVVRAHGTDRVEAVTVSRVDSEWRSIGATSRWIDCDLVAVGFGFSAPLELSTGLGARTSRSSDGGIRIAVDDRQATSVAGLWAAGETTGVAGADCALAEGIIAGAAVAVEAGKAVDPVRIEAARVAAAHSRAFADAVNAAFAVRPGWIDDLADETIICRCEEVTYAELRGGLALGAGDARAAKLLTRTGMGLCQGRICGFPADLLCGGTAAASAPRPLSVPVRLADIATLAPPHTHDDNGNVGDHSD